ncbi:unnamed protein product [Prunus armeniaca]|uniref:FBD domain-containing protein n=1 Tax=Prunus armeniaca TaxID=36596 RepID=A0A6J5VM00_PRUAR|nr:unnamed protein product [Prunus armeniaca]CAB4288720.1 unnamed protein product [Prunus armeniaca]
MAIGERPPCMAIGAVFYGDFMALLLENCSGFNMGYWTLQNISFIHQLKDVTIELSIGSNGIRFAKYVLEHARNLKKMTTQTSRELNRINCHPYAVRGFV